MRELMTTVLDVTGLLLVAAGAGVAAHQVMGWSALAVSGVVLLSASWLAARTARQKGGGS